MRIATICLLVMIGLTPLYYWQTNQWLGHVELYHNNCDKSFPLIQFNHFKPVDQISYFDNPDANCDKLHFLVYFMGGITAFGWGMWSFIIIQFIWQHEIVVRKRYSYA